MTLKNFITTKQEENSIKFDEINIGLISAVMEEPTTTTEKHDEIDYCVDRIVKLRNEIDEIQNKYFNTVSTTIREVHNLLKNDKSEIRQIIDLMKNIPKDDLLQYFIMFPHYLNKFYMDRSYHCKSLLQYVVIYSRNRDPQHNLLKILIEVGANLDLQNKYKWTALMYAAEKSNKCSSVETLKILIKAGASLDLQNKDGWTALMLAARYSNKCSSVETVKILIAADANLNLQNKDGWTALMLAARYYNTTSTEKTVRILIEAGANLNLQNKDKKTAYQLCATNMKNIYRNIMLTSRILPIITMTKPSKLNPIINKYNITTKELANLEQGYIKIQLRSLLSCCKQYILGKCIRLDHI